MKALWNKFIDKFIIHNFTVEYLEHDNEFLRRRNNYLEFELFLREMNINSLEEKNKELQLELSKHVR